LPHFEPHLARALKHSDLLVGNMEGAVVADLAHARTNEEAGVKPNSHKIFFASTRADLTLLKASGLDAMGLANNHNMDAVGDGVPAADVLAAAGLRALGAPRWPRAAYDLQTFVVRGWHVGVVTSIANLDFFQPCNNIPSPSGNLESPGTRRAVVSARTT